MNDVLCMCATHNKSQSLGTQSILLAYDVGVIVHTSFHIIF